VLDYVTLHYIINSPESDGLKIFYNNQINRHFYLRIPYIRTLNMWK